MLQGNRPVDGGGVGIFGQRYDFSGAQAITVVRPNSEVRWRIGALEHIQWTHNLGADATFRIKTPPGTEVVDGL